MDGECFFDLSAICLEELTRITRSELYRVEYAYSSTVSYYVCQGFPFYIESDHACSIAIDANMPFKTPDLLNVVEAVVFDTEMIVVTLDSFIFDDMIIRYPMLPTQRYVYAAKHFHGAVAKVTDRTVQITNGKWP